MKKLLLIALVLGMALWPSVERAEAALYWLSNAGFVGRSNLDGSRSEWPLPDGLAFPALEAGSCGLSVDNQYMYWSDSEGAIGRASLDGTAPNQIFISGLHAPCGVATTATHIYWSDFYANTIGRANLDGSGVDPAFVVGAADPCGLAVDGTYVYWGNQDAGSIGRADQVGGNVDQQFISGLGSPCGVAVGGGRVYWGDQNLHSIGRAHLDGTNVEPVVIADAGAPWDVAVSPAHVYWADRDGTSSRPHGGVGRAALDGSEVNYSFVPSAAFPTGVAVDSLLLTPPSSPPRPSDYLRYGKLTHRRDGSVQLIIHVPARGEFRVAGPKIGWSIDKGNPPPWVGGTFRWKLKLWPGKGTKAAKKIHRRLRRKGRAPVVLHMTYQQEGRLPIDGYKRFAFKRRAT